MHSYYESSLKFGKWIKVSSVNPYFPWSSFPALSVFSQTAHYREKWYISSASSQDIYTLGGSLSVDHLHLTTAPSRQFLPMLFLPSLCQRSLLTCCFHLNLSSHFAFMFNTFFAVISSFIPKCVHTITFWYLLACLLLCLPLHFLSCFISSGFSFCAS